MKIVKTEIREPNIKLKNNRLKQLFYSKKLAPYLFVAPFILSFLVFFLYPIIRTIIMSFQSVLPGEVSFIGFENYQRLLNPTFFKALLNTAEYTFWTLLILIPLPLILAVLLNSKLVMFRNLFRAAFFIPALTSTIVAGIIIRLIFGESDTAMMNSLLIKLGFSPQAWMSNEHTAMFLMVLLASWRWLGVNILYYLAGLQNVPKEIYEAAEMDGASHFQKFRHITLPSLKPVTIYVLTISIISGFRMFEESFVFWQNNSPGDIGLTIVGYIYQQGLAYNDLGFGSAIGIVLLLIILVISLLSLKLTGSFNKEAD
ncbi:carbohydrate ABC transporter permease [Priestia endophytica]|uniref:carbohydrate ABC transporter permease n=1 Tax=Priestia endophytica TaxID=135735 RepID=UPI0020417510|nr:sugar ABC transporter permease [Priestia endophytica]MCM3540676.1 sugar ABC transporter permease [Priestia endophytica]